MNLLRIEKTSEDVYRMTLIYKPHLPVTKVGSNDCWNLEINPAVVFVENKGTVPGSLN